MVVVVVVAIVMAMVKTKINVTEASDITVIRSSSIVDSNHP